MVADKKEPIFYFEKSLSHQIRPYRTRAVAKHGALNKGPAIPPLINAQVLGYPGIHAWGYAYKF